MRAEEHYKQRAAKWDDRRRKAKCCKNKLKSANARKVKVAEVEEERNMP